MTMIAERLKGGDRRSLGASEEVASLVLRDTTRFEELFDAMLHADPLVRMRAADTVRSSRVFAPICLRRFANA